MVVRPSLADLSTLRRGEPTKPIGEEMSESVEFTTWVAMAFAAVVAGICWIFSSSPLVLIPAAIAGAYLGYLAERAGRRYLGRRFAQGR
jgi:hypothetical protein